MPFNNKILLLIILFLPIFGSLGQKLEFEHITNNEGLISSKITCAKKDYKGYMWFGSFDGISRYDGYSFTNYVHDPNDDSSIPDNYVRCLLETSDSTLILGFQFGGIAIYNRDTETFTSFLHDDTDTNSLIHNFVFTLFQDSKSNIWVGTRGGVDLFDIKSKKFIHYKAFPDDDYVVSSITEDDHGQLWLYGKGRSVCIMDPVKKQYEYINFAREMKKAKFYYRGGIIKYVSNQSIWIGTEDGGLYRYNAAQKTIEPFTLENHKLRSNMIFDLMEDYEGNIWVATDGGGISIINSKSGKPETLLHDPEDPTSLGGNGVYCIYESEPGVVWVGVYSAGVNVYKKNKRKFHTITSSGKSNERLSQKSVLTIQHAGENTLWLGTDGGGLNLFNVKTQKFRYFTKENSSIHSNMVKCLSVDKYKNLWIGSYGGGLGKMGLKSGKDSVFKSGKDPFTALFNDHVWSVCTTSDNKIFIGLLGYGLQIYDPLLNTFDYHPFDSAAVEKAVCDVFVLREDHQKRVWIGCEKAGLGFYDPKTKKIEHFYNSPGVADQISGNDVVDILEDSKRNIWVATMWGGLNKLTDINKKTFVNYTTENGLISNNIRSILEDENQDLWLSTDKGISLFKVKENRFINFAKEDGLVNAEFNYNSKYKASDGYLYFGGIDGVTFFHPDSLKFNVNPPKITFTDFKIFNVSISPDKIYDNRIYLKESITIAKEIVLTHEDYVFSIEFAALDFISSANNKYAYQLKGFDEKWTYVGSDKRFATFTNLDPGEYVFNVRASNNDGVWNREGISLVIKILPPWWKTWWFKTFIVLLLFVSVSGFYYIRLRNIEESNRYLSEEVRKRTNELKMANEGLQDRNIEVMLQKSEIERRKNELEFKSKELEHVNKTKDKFFSIIGHDLKGPVTALTFLTNMLRSEWDALTVDTRREYIDHIDKSSNQIKNLVLNLLEWASTQSGQVKLNRQIISIEKLFEENLQLLNQQAVQKEITILKICDKDHYIYGDYNMISTIVRNIFSNSIKYTPRKGQIQLSSQISDNGNVVIIIEDNGIGMSKEILAKLFSLDKGASVKGTEKETGTGLGLVISHEFATLNGGKIYALSTPEVGSSFFIEFPFFDVRFIEKS